MIPSVKAAFLALAVGACPDGGSGARPDDDADYATQLWADGCELSRDVCYQDWKCDGSEDEWVADYYAQLVTVIALSSRPPVTLVDRNVA